LVIPGDIGPPGDGDGKAAGIYEPSPTCGSLQQGDVLSNVIYNSLDLDLYQKNELSVRETPYPYAVVVSQSCDLQWDFNARVDPGLPHSVSPENEHKVLRTIMLCQAEPADAVKGRRLDTMNSSLWNGVKKNKDERYHFFEKVPPDEDRSAQGLPELVVDFKLYFCIPTAELYWTLNHRTERRARLRSPYLEHFATRFFQYQARVATPRQHLSV